MKSWCWRVPGLYKDFTSGFDVEPDNDGHVTRTVNRGDYVNATNLAPDDGVPNYYDSEKGLLQRGSIIPSRNNRAF